MTTLQKLMEAVHDYGCTMASMSTINYFMKHCGIVFEEV